MSIEFDGISCLSRVWLNGEEIGGRPSGYVSFALDLTSGLKAVGGTNILLVRVELQLRDAHCVPVMTDDRDVTFDIEGPARLLGVDSGWENSVQPYQTNRFTTWQGRALLRLQARDTPGTITVTAKSGDIVSAPVTIQVAR